MDSPPQPPPTTLPEGREGPPPMFTAQQLEWLIPRLGQAHPSAWRHPTEHTPEQPGDTMNPGSARGTISNSSLTGELQQGGGLCHLG